MKTQEENMIAINTWCQDFLAANGLTFMKPDISLRAGAGYHGYRFYLDKEGIHAFYTGVTRETFDLDRLIRSNCLIGRELIFHWKEVKNAIYANIEESKLQQKMIEQFTV